VKLGAVAARAIGELERRRVAGTISGADFDRRCDAIRVWLRSRGLAMDKVERRGL
jgi:hypothetical protein